MNRETMNFMLFVLGIMVSKRLDQDKKILEGFGRNFTRSRKLFTSH
tara:strand:- start:444 stop:581 length:138 start_codon:yes stop_codon:yes gene_type:complete